MDAGGARQSTPRTGSATSPTAEDSSRALWKAVDEEVEARELSLARAGQVAGIIGVVVATLAALTFDVEVGIGGGAIAVACLAWFTVRRYATGEGAPERAIRAVSPVFILLFPVAMLLLVWRLRGAELALGSWYPPEIFVCFIGLSTFRMRPAIPLLVGVGSALSYLAFYLAVLRYDPIAQTDSEFLRPGLQVIRASTFLLIGGACALGARGMRQTLKRVNDRARAQDLFGKYRLGAEIASGGMGTVVKATYAPEGGFERPVAIKRIHGHLARSDRFVDAFRAEAELSARLLHPNIVSVLDFGRVDETYFIAMEYVSGFSLADLVDRCRSLGRPIEPAMVAELARQILDGLHFAHEVATDSENRRLRVVHRDLSPNNVLISKAGQVKLLDFGIARALKDHDRLQTQHVAGNFAYMAPEQAEGRPFDERADLFAVGCLVWEMLCGRPLFLRSEGAATLLAVLHDPVPSVLEHRGDLRADWDGFLRQALARSQQNRFPRASKMAAALSALADVEGRPSPEELRAFLREVRRAEPPRKVMSAGAFSGHDAATLPPTRRAPPARPAAPEPAQSQTVKATPPRRPAASGAADLDPAPDLERQDTLIEG